MNEWKVKVRMLINTILTGTPEGRRWWLSWRWQAFDWILVPRKKKSTAECEWMAAEKGSPFVRVHVIFILQVLRSVHLCQSFAHISVLCVNNSLSSLIINIAISSPIYPSCSTQPYHLLSIFFSPDKSEQISMNYCTSWEIRKEQLVRRRKT